MYLYGQIVHSRIGNIHLLDKLSHLLCFFYMHRYLLHAQMPFTCTDASLYTHSKQGPRWTFFLCLFPMQTCTSSVVKGFAFKEADQEPRSKQQQLSCLSVLVHTNTKVHDTNLLCLFTHMHSRTCMHTQSLPLYTTLEASLNVTRASQHINTASLG